MNNIDVNYYINYLKNDRKLSESTVKSYSRDLRLFTQYCSDNIKKDILSISKSDIIIYTIYLENIRKSNSTILRNLASLRNFYSYLLLNNKISESPANDITIKKSQAKAPEILSLQEVDTLFKQPNVETNIGSRDKAMLELIYATGIKVTELTSLNIDDINFDYGYLRCKGKKTEDRIIPVGSVAIGSLKEYILKHRNTLIKKDDEAMFLNYSGSRISRQGFWKILRKHSSSANLNKNVTPFTLRHSFAVHLIQNGADLKSVQELLGHQDVSTTQMYLKLNKNSLREIYDKTHPRA
ncbi:tyrosine recombinase [Helicovermis profundi]|uniref:Site-specific tyrosine recombinase XerD n=1 Tax=Helicovermis profundi TaxID=3065157 RepID=A0AAU9E3A8_9FIRM|nr:site-specific tyrosine recombinase XerD [Clostridia bacterium S502]